MEPDVYICYSSSDKNAADAICHVLEENKFKCWIKPRDVGIGHIAEEITAAIKASKSMVLVFSEHAKASNYVNTEVDMAFSNNVPIIVFKIDDSRLDGGLEFFLENKHWLDAYPRPAHEFRQLVIDVSKLLDRPIADPVVSSEVMNSIDKVIVNVPKDVKPKKNRTKDFIGLFSGMCLLPIIIVLMGIVSNVDDNTGGMLILISLLLFIGTPIYYLIKYYYEKS